MRSILALAAALITVPARAQPPEPTRATAGGAQCTLGTPVDLGTSGVRRLTPAIAFSAPDRGLAAWATDGDHLRVRPISADVGAPVDVELAHAIGLQLVAPAGELFLAVTIGALCPGGERGLWCWHARALRGDGSPAGPVRDEPGGQQDFVDALALVPGGVVLGETARWGARMARYGVAADGSVTVASSSVPGGCPGSAPFLAIAADATRAIAWIDPECENERSIVDQAGTRRVVRGIPTGISGDGETLEIETLHFGLDGDAIDLVFRPAGQRARRARLDLEGHVTQAPVVIAADDPLPPSLAERVRASLSTERGRVTLTRTDVAGRAIGAPLEIARGAGIVAALAWSGADFGVVWATRARGTWTVRMVRARCAP